MVLVDTSVLVDFFRGRKNEAVDALNGLIDRRVAFGITRQVYQELLQGARSELEFGELKDYLGTQLFFEPEGLASFTAAARIYFKCRERGVTVRSTIDCLIAQIAIEKRLRLLHNDNDFVRIARVARELELFA